VASSAAVRELLAATSLPAELVDELLTGAPALWLMGEPAELVAGDLALCHPMFGPGEVRAAVSSTGDPEVWRLSIATRDRRGLLAAAAGALAAQGMSIVRASLSTWPGRGLAVERLLVTRPEAGPLPRTHWDAVGERLRATLGRDELHGDDPAATSTELGDAPTATSTELGDDPTPDGSAPVASEGYRHGERPAFGLRRQDRVIVRAHHGNRTLVRLRAPDRVGLLWATARWLADHDANIEIARLWSAHGIAEGTLIVDGRVDAEALAAHLSGADSSAAQARRLSWAGVLALRPVGSASAIGRRWASNGAGVLAERRASRH